MTTTAHLGWLLIITVGFLALPETARPTLPFGVRVPRDRVREPAIRTTRHGYRAAVVVLGTTAVAAALAGVSGLVPVLVIACMLAHWMASGAVSRAKRAGQWSQHRQGVTTDTTLRTNPVRLPWLFLLPAMAVTVATAALGLAHLDTLPGTLPAFTGLAIDMARRVETTPWNAAWPVTNQLVVLIIAVVTAVVLPRARAELDAAQPSASAQGYRAYLTGTLRLVALVATAAITGLAVIALQLWAVVTPSTWWAVLAAAPVAVASAIALVWLARAGDAGHRLAVTDEDSGVAQRDDDRYWHIGGAVYANRADPALLVHQRLGSRWTLNLGHPLAWVLLTVIAVVAVIGLA